MDSDHFKKIGEEGHHISYISRGESKDLEKSRTVTVSGFITSYSLTGRWLGFIVKRGDPLTLQQLTFLYSKLTEHRKGMPYLSTS